MPEGAFYVFPKIDANGMTSEEMAMEMLAEGVLCSPGSAFGQAGEGHLRFAYTISKHDIDRGMDRVAKVIDRITRKND